jgi:hypothetical protein
MLEYDEARRRAMQHLLAEPLPHPDYQYRLGDGRRLDEGWYFDYAIACVRDIPAEQQEAFAGAAGFIVEDSGEVRDVAFGEWSERRLWAG